MNARRASPSATAVAQRGERRPGSPRGRAAGTSPPLRQARSAARGRPEESGQLPRRRLAHSTMIFSLATALSRVLGLVRQVVAAYYFGAAGKINAFTVAFQFPNLVRALVADAALSSAFVPVFSELIEKGERKRAWRVASSLFWLMLLGLTAVTALFVLIAPRVIGIFGNPGHDRSLAVGLSQVLFPIVALLGISGVFVGILNTYDHFTVPALSPVFWNLAIIAGLAIGVPQAHSANGKLYVYAGSILVATVIQVFLPYPWLRGPRARGGAPADRPRLARPDGQAHLQAHGAGDARPRADQRQRRDRHLLRLPLHQRQPRPDRDPERIPHLHAPAGHVLRRGRDRPLPLAVASGCAGRTRRLPRDARARAAPDRLPPHPGRRPERRARRADRPPPLPARRLAPEGHAGRRLVSRRLQRRARLQRRDADAQPRLLQPAVQLGADGDRAREPVPERAPRPRVLPPGNLGYPALDGAREHRRDLRAADRDASADRRDRGREDRLGDAADLRGRGGARRSRLRRLGAARLLARPLLPRPARLARARARRRHRRLPPRGSRRCACASSTCSCARPGDCSPERPCACRGRHIGASRASGRPRRRN